MLFAIAAAAVLLGRLSDAIAGWVIGRWANFRAVSAGHAWGRHDRRVR